MKNPWHATILSYFPEVFPGPLDISILKKARLNKIWSMETLAIDPLNDKPFPIDDTPYGGGPGMILRPDAIQPVIDKIKDKTRPFIYLSPRGRAFTHLDAKKLAKSSGCIMLCGRYEGIDQRIIDYYNFDEVSVGDFILSGGEAAAFVILDSILRFLPGVIGDPSCLLEESFENNLLEYPHYTRPAMWNNLSVPSILLSGHHKNIALWRQKKAEELTRTRRPDLWQEYMKNR